MFRKNISQTKTKGFTLVEILVTVAVVTMLAALAIPNLLRSMLNANEANARATLKTISNACETFAAASQGLYPTAMDVLTGIPPPYLSEDYTLATRHGYNFDCDTLQVSGYSCTATPLACNRTGNQTFTTTTGGVLIAVDCS
ncbi:type IV pilin protein [Candidatus Omnitrophota bacterium]